MVGGFLRVLWFLSPGKTTDHQHPQYKDITVTHIDKINFNFYTEENIIMSFTSSRSYIYDNAPFPSFIPSHVFNSQ